MTSLSLPKGLIWGASGRWALKLIGIFSSALLVRLLMPDDFGLIAKALLLIGPFEIFVTIKYTEGLIRLKNPTETHFHTAFTLNSLMGIGCFLTLNLLLFVCSSFFEDIRLPLIGHCLSLRLLFYSFENTHMAKNLINFAYKKDFFYLVSHRLLSIILTLSACLYYTDYRGLVIGHILSPFLLLCLSYALKPCMPRFCLKKTKDLHHFSLSNIFSNLFHYLNNSMDKLLLSSFISNSLMGYINLAGELAFQLLHEMIMPFARSLFPIFSHISSDKPLLEQEYNKIFHFLILLIPAMTVGLYLLSEDFILLYAGDRWQKAIPFFELLIISNGLYVFILMQGVIFSATGYEDTRRKLLSFQMILSLIILFPFALQQDILSMLFARIILLCGILLLYLKYIKQYYHVSFLQYIPFLRGVCLANFTMILVHYGIFSYGILAKFIILTLSFFLTLLLFWRDFPKFIRLFFNKRPKPPHN